MVIQMQLQTADDYLIAALVLAFIGLAIAATV
jgi:hypothetical protein